MQIPTDVRKYDNKKCWQNSILKKFHGHPWVFCYKSKLISPLVLQLIVIKKSVFGDTNGQGFRKVKNNCPSTLVIYLSSIIFV
jgi:hypothetical protein